ncbi:hypothetical protein BKA56DRAFT_565754 [Ilyonectria sp. MPI-CAGE-AT-0026]|nr:hypothetical protein BKA56DRAFT_565754 [Ilyonectria sp. MPI-CAGE-AT-0026]
MKSISLALTMLLSSTLAAPADTTYAALAAREEAESSNGFIGGGLGPRDGSKQAEHASPAVVPTELEQAVDLGSLAAVLQVLQNPSGVSKREKSEQTRQTEQALKIDLLNSVNGKPRGRLLGGQLIPGVLKRGEAVQFPELTVAQVQAIIAALRDAGLPAKRKFTLEEREETLHSLGGLVSLDDLPLVDEVAGKLDVKTGLDSLSKREDAGLISGALGLAGGLLNGVLGLADGIIGGLTKTGPNTATVDPVKVLGGLTGTITSGNLGSVGSQAGLSALNALGGLKGLIKGLGSLSAFKDFNLKRDETAVAGGALGAMSQLVALTAAHIPELQAASAKFAEACAEIQAIAEAKALAESSDETKKSQ